MHVRIVVQNGTLECYLSMYLSVCLSICLSVYLSIYLSVCLSVYLSIFLSFFLSFLSIDRSIYLSTCLSIYLSFFLSFYLSFYLSMYLSVCLSIYLSVCLSIYLSFYLSMYLSIYLSVCLSVYLSIYLSVYLSIFMKRQIMRLSRFDFLESWICMMSPLPTWSHMPINLDISRDSWTVQQREYLLDFSPTAIALGSSAIVKVSGLNRFRTLYGSLGQACLGPPEGSANVPPSLRQFRGVSGLLGQIRAAKRFCGRLQQGFTEVSPRLRMFRYLFDLLGQIVLGCQKVPRKVPPGLRKFRYLSGFLGRVRFGLFWAAKRFRKSSVEGSIKVPPGFHRGSTKISPNFGKFCDLSCLLVQIRFGVPNPPITYLNLSPNPSTLFRIFLNSVSFGGFRHSIGLGFRTFWKGSVEGQMAVAS